MPRHNAIRQPSPYEIELRSKRAEAARHLEIWAKQIFPGDGQLVSAIKAHADVSGFDRTICILKQCLETMGEQRYALQRLSPAVDRNGQTLMF